MKKFENTPATWAKTAAMELKAALDENMKKRMSWKAIMLTINGYFKENIDKANSIVAKGFCERAGKSKKQKRDDAEEESSGKKDTKRPKTDQSNC